MVRITVVDWPRRRFVGVHISSAPQDHALIWQLAEDLRKLGYAIVDRTMTGDIAVFAVSDDAIEVISPRSGALVRVCA
jgi:hypothetical protein